MSPRPDDSRRSAAAAGLRYVSDDCPGITRRRCGRGWSYRDPEGTTIRDPEVRKRIEALAIPPAWEEVWICPRPDGHVQATGRDAEGRKQYRYHPEWSEIRSATKFERMVDFGRALAPIRARVAEDLEREGMPRERVLAAVVQLLASTGLRVGNDAYQRQNGTYGLTTLHDGHVTARDAEIRFRFRGKGGEEVTAAVTDDRVAAVVRECQELDGQDLFTYVDDEGRTRDVTSGDVNDYLGEISGDSFTAKDFRTWVGTLHAFVHLARVGTDGDVDPESSCREALDLVAERLQNTRAVCRDFYVHPAVLDAFRSGDLPVRVYRRTSSDGPELSPPEAALLEVLERITGS